MRGYGYRYILWLPSLGFYSLTLGYHMLPVFNLAEAPLRWIRDQHDCVIIVITGIYGSGYFANRGKIVFFLRLG